MQILHKICSPPPTPLIRNVQKFLRGDPYYSLHISEGGGLAKMCDIGLPAEALYYSTFYSNSRDLGTAHQAWPLANSAYRLAFGQTESYIVHSCLQLAAMIGPAVYD